MTLSIRLSSKRVFLAFLVAIAALIAASIAFNSALVISNDHAALNDIVHLVNLSGESNIPTWFTSSIFLVCSLLLYLIALAKYQSRDSCRHHWAGLAFVFILLSLDATATIHDWLLEQDLVSTWNTRGFLFFPWVIPGWIFVGLMTVIYFRFVFALPAQTRNLFIGSAIIYITGALVFEMMSAYLMDFYTDETIWRGLVATIKQSLELLGIITFIYGLLTYIRSQIKVVKLEIVEE